jgi:hypothetical protein
LGSRLIRIEGYGLEGFGRRPVPWQDRADGHDALARQRFIDQPLTVDRQQQRLADRLVGQEDLLRVRQIEEDYSRPRKSCRILIELRVRQHFSELVRLNLRQTLDAAFVAGGEHLLGGVVGVELDAIQERTAAIEVIEGRQADAGDAALVQQEPFEAEWPGADRLEVERVVDEILNLRAAQQMVGEQAFGQVIEEGGERLGQLELDRAVVEANDVDRLPHFDQIGRPGVVRVLELGVGVDHVVRGDAGPVVPDGVISQGDGVERAVGRDRPAFRQIRLGQPAAVERHQAAVDQPVDVSIDLVPVIEQRIEARNLADEGLAVGPALGRDGRADLPLRALRYQQDHKQRETAQGDQDLPAEGANRGRRRGCGVSRRRWRRRGRVQRRQR